MQTQPNVVSIDEQLRKGEWTHGLCGCFDNLSVCIVAYFCPCVTFGQTREKLAGKGCVLYALLYLIPFVDCFLEAQQRQEIRRQRGIDGGCCGDLLLICCCPLCTLVQEEQEAIALQAERNGLQTSAHYVAPGGAIVVGSSSTQVTSYVTQPGAPQNPPDYNNVYPPLEVKEMDRS